MADDSSCNISVLPDELILEIFAHLPHRDLFYGVGQTCRKFRTLSRCDPFLWRRIVCRRSTNDNNSIDCKAFPVIMKDNSRQVEEVSYHGCSSHFCVNSDSAGNCRRLSLSSDLQWPITVDTLANSIVAFQSLSSLDLSRLNMPVYAVSTNLIQALRPLSPTLSALKLPFSFIVDDELIKVLASDFANLTDLNLLVLLTVQGWQTFFQRIFPRIVHFHVVCADSNGTHRCIEWIKEQGSQELKTLKVGLWRNYASSIMHRVTLQEKDSLCLKLPNLRYLGLRIQNAFQQNTLYAWNDWLALAAVGPDGPDLFLWRELVGADDCIIRLGHNTDGWLEYRRNGQEKFIFHHGHESATGRVSQYFSAAITRLGNMNAAAVKLDEILGVRLEFPAFWSLEMEEETLVIRHELEPKERISLRKSKPGFEFVTSTGSMTIYE